MALVDIFIAVRAALGENQSAGGVLSRFNQQGRQDAPPRVIWNTDADRFSKSLAALSLLPHNAVGTRGAGVILSIWAAGEKDDQDEFRDERALESLLNRVYFEVRKATRGNCEFGAGRMLPRSENQLGLEYELPVIIPVPITLPCEQQVRSATIKKIPRVGSLSVSGDTEEDSDDDGTLAS